MTKANLLINYKVDADKVKFERSANGLYEFSVKSFKGRYLIKENNDYTVVVEATNSKAQWACDLSGLEG